MLFRSPQRRRQTHGRRRGAGISQGGAVPRGAPPLRCQNGIVRSSPRIGFRLRRNSKRRRKYRLEIRFVVVQEGNNKICTAGQSLGGEVGQFPDAFQYTRDIPQSCTRLHPADQLGARCFWHMMIGKQKVHAGSAEYSPRFLAIRCRKHVKAEGKTNEPVQPDGQDRPHGRVVVDDKDGFVSGHSMHPRSSGRSVIGGSVLQFTKICGL